MAEIVKILLFDESMESVLLERGAMLQPISAVIRSGTTPREAIGARIHNLLHMDIQQQPIWRIIRTERYQADEIRVYIVYGKVSHEELIRAEADAELPFTIFSTSSKQGLANVLNPRLNYYLPMAMMYDRVDFRKWPAP